MAEDRSRNNCWIIYDNLNRIEVYWHDEKRANKEDLRIALLKEKERNAHLIEGAKEILQRVGARQESVFSRLKAMEEFEEPHD